MSDRVREAGERDRWVAFFVGLVAAGAAGAVREWGIAYALVWASVVLDRLWPYITKEAPDA